MLAARHMLPYGIEGRTICETTSLARAKKIHGLTLFVRSGFGFRFRQKTRGGLGRRS
jgi:hypothetical protein